MAFVGKRQGPGDEGRGALCSGSLCGSDKRAAPVQKPKGRTLIGPAETPLNRATSSRNAGRNHLGTPSDIKSELDYALSSAIKVMVQNRNIRAVSAGLNDGAQQGAISKGAQRGPVCCSLRNRGSVPGGGDALALAIWLCVPGLRRRASQFRQDPGALPVYRLSTADIRDRRNDFRGDQGAAVH